MYFVIMAGGVGSRFWPLSRADKPKQLLNLLGESSMLRMTFERIRPIAQAEKIIVVTNTNLVAAVRNELPEVPQENIIGEPFGRNTAPCIGLAASLIEKRAGKAEIMVVLPADHLIKNDDLFRKTILAAVEYAGKSSCLITLGVKPTYPETGYGYIQRNHLKATVNATDIFSVKTFAEKPNREAAERFLHSGDFFWNSGMFIWSVASILNEFENHLPEHAELFRGMVTSLDTPEQNNAILDVYSGIRAVSIDFGIMEVAEQVCVIAADFEWNDVGSWEAVYNISPKDAHGNVVNGGQAVTLDAANNFFYTNKKVVSAIGIENLVVVETDDTLLICRKDESQRVKDLVDILKRKNLNQWL